MSENNNNLGAAARFGSDTQKQLAEQQRRANSSESGHVNKCTIVVLTTLNAHNRFCYLSADEQLREHAIVGKVMDRLPGLLALSATNAAPDSAAYILHPNNGAPVRIDERIKVGEGDAVIVSYTVNKTVSEMHGSLSLALFGAGADDLLDLAASHGIHAIAIVDEAKAHDFISALASQVESLQTVNISSIDETDGAFDKPVIAYDVLPGNPVTVLSGAVRTFIMQTTGGEVFAAIPNNGELIVKQDNNATPVDLEEDFDQDDEVVDTQGEGEEDAATGTDLFGYKAESLSVEQMSEALEALSYDVSAMNEEGVRESFETEQQIWLDKSDAVEGADDQEEDAEEEGEEEEDDFDAVQYLASLLAAEELDRDGLKVLVRSQDLKVMKSDTVETLTTKLLELVDGATEQEMFELIDTFVGALQEREIECPNMLAAIATDDDQEEDNEEDSEEEDDEEEEDLDDESEESEEEDDEDEVQAQIDAITDPLDYFQFAGGSLTAEQRAAAVEAMGENTTGLNIVQVMKAFSRIQEQTGETEVGADVEDDLSEDGDVTDLLSQYDDATIQHVAESLGILVDECETADEMIDAIVNGGSEDDFAAADEIAESYGVDLTDVDGDWAGTLLLILPPFLSDDESAEQDEDESESEDPEEDEVEADIGEVQAAPANDSLKFLKSVDRSNAVGPMVAVESLQTVVINFSLTDGNTYQPIEEELADVDGINYRFPFNMGGSDKPQGAMLVPANSLLGIMERAGTSRFLTNPNTFNIGVWADSLEQTLNEEVANMLYAGRIPEGADPHEAGIVVGDFIDEEEMADALELGHIDASQYDELTGDRLPIASLYNATVCVRPVQVDNAHCALTTAVLNVAIPGFWSAMPKSKLSGMVQAAVNRVISLSSDVENIKVYAGFTLESAALLNNDNLFTVLATLREFENVQSYSAADAANFNDADDVIEVASALDDRDLPFVVLSSGIAAATFENGGDLTVLVPCNLSDDDEEDEGDDE